MIMFENVESAYQAMATAALDFPQGRPWNAIYGKYGIFNKMISVEWGIIRNGIKDEKGKMPPKETRNLSMDAAHYLRDHILKTTGERIWGLTFTLYPTGKFNIEYNYNIPSDYEDSDEIITGEEINQSLSELGVKKQD